MNMKLRRALFLLVVVGGCRQAAGIDDLEFASGEGGSAQTSASSVAASGAGGQVGSASSASSSVGATTAAASSSGGGGAGGAGGAGGETIGCGAGTTCPFGMESTCCWDSSAKQGQCTMSAAQCDDDVGIQCQSSGQCAIGLLCCAEPEGLGMYKEARCRANCDNPRVVLCDIPGEGDPSCPPSSICLPDATLPDGYFVCVTD